MIMASWLLFAWLYQHCTFVTAQMSTVKTEHPGLALSPLTLTVKISHHLLIRTFSLASTEFGCAVLPAALHWIAVADYVNRIHESFWLVQNIVVYQITFVGRLCQQSPCCDSQQNERLTYWLKHFRKRTSMYCDLFASYRLLHSLQFHILTIYSEILWANPYERQYVAVQVRLCFHYSGWPT